MWYSAWLIPTQVAVFTFYLAHSRKRQMWDKLFLSRLKWALQSLFLWAFHYDATFMWMKVCMSQIWRGSYQDCGLKCFPCLLCTTLSSHTDTAPISTSTLKARGLCSTAYKPYFGGDTVYLRTEKASQRCQVICRTASLGHSALWFMSTEDKNRDQNMDLLFETQWTAPPYSTSCTVCTVPAREIDLSWNNISNKWKCPNRILAYLEFCPKIRCPPCETKLRMFLQNDLRHFLIFFHFLIFDPILLSCVITIIAFLRYMSVIVSHL